MTKTTKHKPFRRWPLFLIAAPAFVAVWSGWVGLGGKTGFGPVHLFPGVNIFGLSHFILNTAITLPIGVESYGAYAMGAWLHPRTPKKAQTFARRSALGSLVLGTFGQVAYHLMAAAHIAKAPWWITMCVSALPVITLGFGAALTHLLREQNTDEDADIDADDETPGVRPPMAVAWPEAGEEVEPRSRRTNRQLQRAIRKYKREPSITGAAMGEYLGVSPRHGQRILNDAKAAVAAEAGVEVPLSANLTDEEPVEAQAA